MHYFTEISGGGQIELAGSYSRGTYAACTIVKFSPYLVAEERLENPHYWQTESDLKGDALHRRLNSSGEISDERSLKLQWGCDMMGNVICEAVWKYNLLIYRVTFNK